MTLKKLTLLPVLVILISVNLKAQPYRIVEANTAFAFDFYKACRDADSENIFISPFSISSALAMTYPGARGKTAEEMKLAMGFLNNLKKQNEEYSYLTRDLTESGGPFLITNTLWTHQGLGYEAEFMDINATYFGAAFKEVNFADAENTRKQINTAIEEQTRNKIKDLMPPGSISMDTRLVLTNAVYFKDVWAIPFKKENTREDKFYVQPEQPVNAMFMQHSGPFNGFENDVVSILELPYKHRNFSMRIVLPKISMKKFEDEFLSAENYFLWQRSSVRFNNIRVPRFKFELATDPVPILKKFGMTTAFKEGEADFTGITTEQHLAISGIYHKAFVEVNEEGTEAAAATGVAAAERSMAAEPRDFIANRPFIFMVVDNRSGSILFLGKLVNPD